MLSRFRSFWIALAAPSHGFPHTHPELERHSSFIWAWQSGSSLKMLHAFGAAAAQTVAAVRTVAFPVLAATALLTEVWVAELCGDREGRLSAGTVARKAGAVATCGAPVSEWGMAETNTDFETPDRAQWTAANAARATTATASLLMETEEMEYGPIFSEGFRLSSFVRGRPPGLTVNASAIPRRWRGCPPKAAEALPKADSRTAFRNCA